MPKSGGAHFANGATIHNTKVRKKRVWDAEVWVLDNRMGGKRNKLARTCSHHAPTRYVPVTKCRYVSKTLIRSSGVRIDTSAKTAPPDLAD